MNPASVLRLARTAGFTVEVAGDSLRVTGGDLLPDDEYRRTLQNLAGLKVELLQHIREQAFQELLELTRTGGLRWTAYPEGAFMPDYPRGTAWPVIEHMENLRYQAHPLQYERKEELLALQRQADGERLARRGWQA